MITKRKLTIGLLFWGFLLIVGLYNFGMLFTKESHSTVVTDKERVVQDGDKGSKYLVFTPETTFEITDQLYLFRWNSSDVYGKVQKDKCYTFNSYGWRIPIFSMYPNAADFKVIDCNQTKD